MSSYTLLTGATGLVGRYLVRDLLSAGQPLALVIRPTKSESAAERVESLVLDLEAELGRSLPRPEVFQGDVSEPGLGLSAVDLAWVGRNCDRVLHNAAILEFIGPDRSGEPWKTNLNGTRNMLNLCRDLGLTDLHYVSTAYVSGVREGTVYENELDCGQKFRNDYEASKCEAEQLVRQADFLDRPTVYRPAVIAGDSKTGFTSTYHGLYTYLQLMNVVIHMVEPDETGFRMKQTRLCVAGDDKRNIVPVDWVSAAICRLMENPRAKGETFHLAPEIPLTPQDIVDVGMRYWRCGGIELCGRDFHPDRYPDIQPHEAAVFVGTQLYSSYEVNDPTFDLSNLRRLLPDLPCPRIDHAMLERFIRFAEDDNWGRGRRRRKAKGKRREEADLNPV